MVRRQETGVRGQESGVRGQESGVKSQESGVGQPIVPVVQSFLPGEKVVADNANESLSLDQRRQSLQLLAEEVAKWVRHHLHLQLVEDGMFAAAQARLDQEEVRCAAYRASDGRLRGSRAGTAAPRHLLQGLIKCSACEGTFRVGGANGKYLGCAGYQKGVCAVKTSLPRHAAECRLLAVIGEHVLDNPAWLDAVVHETRAAWEEVRRQNEMLRELA